MIQSLRNNAAIIMWIVIVAFIATIVFAWGMDLSSRNRVRDTVGKVNGKEITYRTFERMVAAEREKERERNNGVEASPEQSRMLPRQVWQMEVSRILMDQAFADMDIGASTDEVYEYIKKNPPPEVYSVKQFQTDSVFDTSKFVSFLNNPAVYENEGMQALEKHTREFLVPMQTLRLLLSMQEFPFKSEIAYQYNEETEKAVFEYAKVNVAAFAPPRPTDAEVAAYYQAHQDSFATPEQVDLYYVKIPKIATPADEKATYDEMLNLRAKLKVGDSSFAEEAKLESDDEATASRGGYLGWVTKGSTAPQFDSAVFALKVNEISMPVRTQFGYHLVLVEKRETSNGKERATVRHILRKIVPSGETLDKLNALADSVRGIIVSDGILNVAKKVPSVRVDSTGLFKRGDQMPKVGYVSGAAGFAFAHVENELSDLLENEDGYFFFQVKTKVKKGILPLEVAKERIVATLSDSIRLAKAHGYFVEFLKKVPDKNAVAQYSKSDSLIISGVTDTVGRAQYIPQVGFNNQLVAAAFALPIGKVSSVIEGGGSYFVVKPLWQKKPGNNVPWGSTDVLNINRKMIQDNMEKNYYDWYLYYMSKAKIVDNVNQFYLD
ncbi:MAG TPA: SurA N-terminal domain-containing protein [Chitinivibrionales bacterium]|nr:SurA N-terminal domain-containing protein [Chitinivibrionales bacterium]